MIWLALIFVVVTLAAVLLVARTPMIRVALAVGLLLAGAGYWALGKPGAPDQPYAKRLAEIDKLDPNKLNLEQAMAKLQDLAAKRPSDPAPHRFMGELLAQMNMPERAAMAYQSALRRDPNDLQSLKSFADMRFLTSGGAVDADTLNLYRAALERAPDDVRVEFMVGLGEWQGGDRDKAKARWNALEQRVDKADPRYRMMQALRSSFADGAPAPAEGPSAPAPSPAPRKSRR